MKPILKYAGGKGRELDKILPHVPTDFDRYAEPFMGGGALYFHLKPEQALLGDMNSNLMAFYFYVKTCYDLLDVELDYLAYLYNRNQLHYEYIRDMYPDVRVENGNEELYYKIRDMFNTKQGIFCPGTVFYFLNKTAFSGLVRFNAAGEFNVPFAHYPNFSRASLTKEHHDLLRGATLYTGDYSAIFHVLKEDDFVFLDPPYYEAFSDYTPEGFTPDDHVELARQFKNLNCRALMILGKAPFTEQLYDGYIVDEYEKNYAVNVRNRIKTSAVHMIIRNY